MIKHHSSNMEISIVIPNYNNQLFIEKCIRSVLIQSYQYIKEIIVVDDASTDNSRNIINDIANEDDRIIPIFLEKNGKVSAARNAGLRRVTSEYVSFLDGDDYYYNPQKIENEMALIANHYNDQNVITYSYIARIAKDDSIISLSTISENDLLIGNIYNKLLLRNNLGNIMRDYCVRTELLRSIGGYNEQRSFFEDYEVILKMAKNSCFFCTKEFGTGYRVSENGLSNRPYNEQLNTINSIACDEIKHLPLIKRIAFRTIRFFSYRSRILLYKIKQIIVCS